MKSDMKDQNVASNKSRVNRIINFILSLIIPVKYRITGYKKAVTLSEREVSQFANKIIPAYYYINFGNKLNPFYSSVYSLILMILILGLFKF